MSPVCRGHLSGAGSTAVIASMARNKLTDNALSVGNRQSGAALSQYSSPPDFGLPALK
ncbi:hypothetical protein [Tatumella sp. UBA2305]|uniref:hypothetical protein n=1 Tax=Tatumella sp. UBA2305 TaxID=1947647 RepID=UPI0025D6BCFB|nr:hypothetical protein [Tatumella sp. UBA2305]